MKIQNITLYIFILLLLCGGWKVYRFNNPNFATRFAENSLEFREQRENLNELLAILYQEAEGGIMTNKILTFDEMSARLQDKMQELGFSKITIESVSVPCSQNFIISFEVEDGWNIDVLNHVEVVFSPCDEETKAGYHRFDGYHIDVWGQGKDWKIFSDTDFI